LTPSIGLAPDSQPVSETSNEDFLFHLYRGSELLQDNRVHEAKEELERALHLQPRDSKGQDLIAVVYFRLGLYPRAISIYEQLRRKNANDTALLLNLALCYLKTGQPTLARRDLEHLLTLNPGHQRAWGYLGLACERLGDLEKAQRAFEQGGHGQMAKRMQIRRESMGAPPTEDDAQPNPEVRGVVATAYQELDAGELSFALAEPTSETPSGDEAAQSWRPVELGHRAATLAVASAERPETQKPDTKDGPKEGPQIPGAPSVPNLGVPQSLNRRPTLIAPVGVPPAEAGGYMIEKLPSQRPPAFSLDEAGTPSLRRPVVAVPPVGGRGRAHALHHDNGFERHDRARTKTLPPPVHQHASAPPPAQIGTQLSPPAPEERTPTGPRLPTKTRSSAEMRAAAVQEEAVANDPGMPPTPRIERPATSPPAAADLARDSIVRFPEGSGVVIHHSGVALVHTSKSAGFATRLEAIRAQSNGLAMKLLERQQKGKPTGESFGGVGSPVVIGVGDGQLVLAPRSGRKISSFILEDEMCFAREEVLLGFDGELSFENGRLATGEGEFVPVVQLRGKGAVLLEAIGDILTLDVKANRGLSVRREVILGWFGRLVPRALAPSESPCGQRGLVSFAGEGRVLVASA